MNYSISFKPRIVKVENTSDPHRKQIKLRIRLEGNWIAQAGLRADQHVKVLNPEPGLLVIQSL